MGIFSKKNQTPWRNYQGRIACPGDSCPMKCDDSCPIMLNTKALMHMSVGADKKALKKYQKAVKIAPDFSDAWNNMGAVYGNMKIFEEAYECYRKAYEIDSSKWNAIFGLVMTSCDLELYEECISWCTEYRKLCQDGREVPYRRKAKEKLGRLPSQKKQEEAAEDKPKYRF